MNIHVSRCARASSPVVIACLLLLTGALGMCPVAGVQAADPSSTVVRVEEDWELVLLTPDAESTAPQVTCAFSPLGQLDSVYATFELNHQSQPGFAPGGLHLQLWRDETSLGTHSLPTQQVLSTTGETVHWTQVMSWQPGNLTFEIIGGDSVTWGAFGGLGNLHDVVATELNGLNGYSPQVSVANSGVGFAGNRVQSLSLKAVRLVTSTGEVWADTTVRRVYPQN